MVKAWQNALSVTEREVAEHIPTEIELSIAEAMLQGKVTGTDIAEYTGVDARTIWKILQDPVATRWICEQVDAHIASRMGMIAAAMFARAVNGDVSAAKLCLERFGKLINRSEVVVHKGVDFGKMSGDDLVTFIRDKMSKCKVIDADFEARPGVADPSPGGAGAPEEGSAAPPLPPEQEAGPVP